MNRPSIFLADGQLPGKVGTHFMATALLGCLLGPWRSQVEAAGTEDFQREGPSGECLGDSWEWI